MPKIRGVKPDYWTDEDIVELTIPARLLFIGLWNYACDNGHLPDKPKQIKMRVFPGDEVNVAELLRELEGAGRIKRANGWTTIPKFAHHQKPNRRFWLTCEMPGCVKPDKDSQPETPSDQGEPSLPKVGKSGPPADGDVDCDVDGEVMVSRSRKRARQLPDDFRPSREHVDLATSLGIDLRAEFSKFRDYWKGEGKPKADWDATLRNWIRKAAEYNPQRPALRVAPNGEPIIPLALDDRR